MQIILWLCFSLLGQSCVSELWWFPRDQSSPLAGWGWREKLAPGFHVPSSPPGAGVLGPHRLPLCVLERAARAGPLLWEPKCVVG